MKKRMHLKYRKKRSKTLIVFILLVLTLFILAVKKYIDVRPLIVNFSEMEANKLATLIINTAIIDSNVNVDDLYETSKTNDEVLMIDYNADKVNQMLGNITLKIQNIFGSIESGEIDNIGQDILQKYNYDNLKKGVILKVPLGYLTGNPFLANLGPKIPLKITLIGDVRTDIKTEVKNYGLNNALLKIYIYIEVVTQSIFPVVSNIETTIVEYPIVLKVIQGKVPTYIIGNN